MLKIYYNWQTKFWEDDSIILHHTGNMFGVGCSAFNTSAVKRLADLKGRNDAKGFIVLIPDLEALADYGVKLTDAQIRLLHQYWPGDVSFVLHTADPRFDSVSINQTVAFRVPSSGFLRTFLQEWKAPMVSTSINHSGEDFLDDLDDIKAKFSNWFDFGILSEMEKFYQAVPSTLVDLSKGDLICLREGAVPFSAIKEAYHRPLITFVCTGNICRSPLAEYYCAQQVAQKGLAWRVASAGLLDSGNPISKNSLIILKELGIDASHHQSRRIDKYIITNSYLILTMTEEHKRTLISHFPNCAAKIKTLSEAVNLDNDIEDPYGLDLNFYRIAFNEIKERIDSLLENL